MGEILTNVLIFAGSFVGVGVFSFIAYLCYDTSVDATGKVKSAFLLSLAFMSVFLVGIFGFLAIAALASAITCWR